MLDELALIEGYSGVPWLIWIQILVLLLLILLLLGFFTLSSTPDPSNGASSSSSGGFYGSPYLDPASDYKVSASCHYNQVGENCSIKGEIATSTARRMVVEDNPERDRGTATDASHLDLHPCNYFKIAKLAFLKCLGLECLYDKSSNLERRKER